MARWVTATLCCAALFGCHPLRAAIDRGDLTEACRLGSGVDMDDEGADRDALHAVLMARVDLTWNIERVSLLDLAPQDAVAVATGLEQLTRKTFYRMTFEAKALPAGAAVLLEPPELVTPRHDEVVDRLRIRWPEQQMDDISLLLRTPLEPSYELVPAQSLPREYVEESEPGKWVYRGNVDPAQLTLAVVTGGLSAIFLGPDLGREAEWVPASPAEKAALKKQAPSRRKAFEREEAARLAEGRKVVEAVLARNQARKTVYERGLAAQQAVRTALIALVQTEACSGDGSKFRLEAGHRCVLFATTSDRGPPVLQPADGKAVLRLRGELALGAERCNWHFKEELPAGRDETIGPMSARVFSTGPRRLQPVRSHWPE